MLHAKQTLTAGRLLTNVRGCGGSPNTKKLQVRAGHIRKKIEATPGRPSRILRGIG